MIFIESKSTHASSYCISTTGNHIILKACIRLTTIKKGNMNADTLNVAANEKGNISISIFKVPQEIIHYSPSLTRPMLLFLSPERPH